MATVAREIESKTTRDGDREARVVLRGIPWDLYEVLRENEDNRHVRMAYDDGSLELMSPSRKHEEIGHDFSLIFASMLEAVRIQCRGLAQTTWKNPTSKKGKEADACYYLSSIEKFRAVKNTGEPIPPPDLAVEVEVSRSSLAALAIYAALGVPEVWRFDGFSFRAHILQVDGTYLEVDRSVALPFLRFEEIAEWLERAAEFDDDTELMRQVRDWARDVLVPRLGNG